MVVKQILNGRFKIRLLTKALELAARDSCEYDCGDAISSKTLDYIIENYLAKAKKELDKGEEM